MAVGGYNDFAIKMWRGDDQQISIAVTDDADAPQDITGWDLWLTGKTAKTDLDAAAVFQLTIGSGITVVSAAGGTAPALLANDDTSGLSDDSTVLYVDLQAKDGSGDIHTLQAGLITVYADITLAII